MEPNHNISTRPAIPEDVLDILRDWYRLALAAGEAIPDGSLSFNTAVDDWRDLCDLLPWRKLGRAMNSAWKIDCSDDEWRSVLEPARSRTLQDVCDLIARDAKLPQIASVDVLGSLCATAGAFLTIRSFFEEAGANAELIGPSTSLDEYARKYMRVFTGPITILAPGALPPATVEIERFKQSAGFALGCLGWMMLIAAALGSRPWLGVAGLVLMALAQVIFWNTRTTQAQFGDLRTFRDLAKLLAARAA